MERQLVLIPSGKDKQEEEETHRPLGTHLFSTKDSDAGTREMKENITPALKAVDISPNFNQQNSKLPLVKDTNTMLLDYLDEMKSRRKELNALQVRPGWALMPVSPIQNTNYAVDDESQAVGKMLYDFFNASSSIVINGTMPRDRGFQDTANDARAGTDVLRPKIPPLSNMALCTPENVVPLVPKPPHLKSISRAIVLEELVEGLRTLECEETGNGPIRTEAIRTTDFNSLEYKLREYIWTLALPRTRIIELVKSPTCSIHSHATVPSLLHTCRESRAIAMKHYTLAFTQTPTTPKVYFDFKYDWIYTRCSGCLGAGCTHKLTLTDDHQKLKGLIFEGPMTFNPFPKILRLYPGIERLILISGKSDTEREEINKSEISFMTKVFEWDSTGDLMELARKAWETLYPTGERRLSLTQIWRATLPDVVDDIKRSSDPAKGLWTCCS